MSPADPIMAIAPKTSLRLNHPVVQNLITGLVIACSAGIYLALTGLGAGGGKPSSQALAATSNSVLYALFAVAGWLSAGLLNAFGPKITMALGVLGYPLFAGGLWYFDVSGNAWFAIFGAAMNGIGAGLLFTAAGFVQFAYAEEKEKGLFIFWQHTMLSGGSIVGAIVTFGINFHKTRASVPSSVYAIFIATMAASSLIALGLIISPKKVIRGDGTHLAEFKQTTVREELVGLWRTISSLKVALMLFPMFVSEFALGIQTSFNGYYFSLRTRALNTILYNALQIVLPAILAALLDAQWIGVRKVRGIVGVAFTAATTISLAVAELVYFRQNVDRTVPGPSMDWSDPGYGEIMVLHLLWGGCFCCWTFTVQWIMGSMSNKPDVLSRYAGLFKGTSSLGVCAAFAIDARKPQYWVEMAIHLGLYVAAILIMFYVVWSWITDTDYLKEEGVIIPKHVAEELIITEGVSEADKTKSAVEEKD
ncbi:hypothetical protein ASPSYDRAFT_86662 [Aspergillus sydowii CBS 593.65]|uniref:Major facilitator superfamily (MFS) profile domain-containing protein n=1 Tax=Aspergillus sydowii CBS 593.65 TaxID=1036612 RepID=A0A1L9TUA3_9EURO|nr:uncharacterized protein ASPSYDRAFT_86662 [Aspergillus sydowii CBS 593.65]OJJ63014.1 hypothetical protein ASPSYDRAFT_86662 [Aspergillus sydowii CBS 593.65]